MKRAIERERRIEKEKDREKGHIHKTDLKERNKE